MVCTVLTSRESHRGEFSLKKYEQSANCASLRSACYHPEGLHGLHSSDQPRVTQRRVFFQFSSWYKVLLFLLPQLAVSRLNELHHTAARGTCHMRTAPALHPPLCTDETHSAC